MKLAMISLSQLNRLIYFSIFSSILIFNAAFATTAVDIWKKKEVPKELTDNEEEEEIDSSILSDEQNNISIKIDEEQIIADLQCNNKKLLGKFGWADRKNL